MNPVDALQVAFGAATLLYLVWCFQGARRKRSEGLPGPVEIGVGAVTNFFDTLGIGSFAPTTAAFRALRLVRDEWIPGTLNVGHLLPTVLQAAIFVNAVSVDPTTLILMIAAASAGAYLGAGVVAGMDRRYVQLGMGIALLCSAGLFAARNLGLVWIAATVVRELQLAHLRWLIAAVVLYTGATMLRSALAPRAVTVAPGGSDAVS